MKIRDMNQGSPQWKAWRSGDFLHGKRFGGGIGGSDVAGLLNISPYTNPPHNRESVFAEKVFGTEREANFAMRRGQNLESFARDLYQQRTRCTAAPLCVEMDGCEWARVSLDGLCAADPLATAIAKFEGMPPAVRERAIRDALNRAASDTAERWILELKAPDWKTHDAALNGVVAEHFGVQIQWQMLVCGLNRCDFASFNPSERFTPAGFPAFEVWKDMHPSARPTAPADWLAVHTVAADPEKQAWIMEEAAGFWFEVLEARAAFEKEAGVA